MLLESFVGASLFNGAIAVPEPPTQPPEDMRRNQYLITNDVERYMAEYEVRYAPLPFYAPAGAKITYYRPAGTPT
jgi:hypothetical protein